MKLDKSVPIIAGTVVAEVLVVAASFWANNFLNRRSDQSIFTGDSRAKEDADVATSPDKRPIEKVLSYKDERQSYFDHAATATQIRFERKDDQSE